MTTPTLIEAARAALDALGSLIDAQNGPPLIGQADEWDCAMYEANAAIDALRAAIEAAESAQPVAFITRESMMRLSNGGNDSRGTVPVHRFASAIANRPLYLHPPESTRQPLTDDEIRRLAGTPAAIPGTFIHAIVRAVERHHRIESESK